MNCLDPLQNHHSSAVHIPGPYFLNKVIKIPVRRYKYVLGQEVYMLSNICLVLANNYVTA